MSIFNNNLGISVFGESHGSVIGITIHNFPSNITLNIEKIARDLQRRREFTIGKSTRTELDEFEIISGYYNNKTTGAPLSFLIRNKDVDSSPYLKNQGVIRPSHGDYPAYIKSKGTYDFRGGGHMSGRLTSLFVILGSICGEELNKRKINVYSRIKSIHNIIDNDKVCDYTKLDTSFPVYNQDKKLEMIEFLKNLNNDSVGGVVETLVTGMGVGIGNPLFDSVESILSHVMFAVGGVKGIEFGKGFDITKMMGSEANDQIQYQGDKIVFDSNYSGGIQGGMTNGNEICFRCAIKPTPSISVPLKSININTKENVVHQTKGRHDKAIIIKAVHVINHLTAFVMYDLLLGEHNG